MGEQGWGKVSAEVVWALLGAPLLFVFDLWVLATGTHLVAEPTDTELFHYLNPRKIVEASCESSFQALMQAYICARDPVRALDAGHRLLRVPEPPELPGRPDRSAHGQ